MAITTWSEFTTQSCCLNDKVLHEMQDQEKKRQQEWSKHSFMETMWNSLKSVNQAKGSACEGDKRLKRLNLLLDEVFHRRGWQRTEHQTLFHDQFIIACLPKIYGEEWEAVSARVMNQFNIKSITSMVLAFTPRRFGKTTGVGGFCGPLMLSVPGIHITTFSTGKRASSLMMGEVKTFLVTLDNIQDRIVEDNVEVLKVAEYSRGENVGINTESTKRIRALPTTSTFHSYPSNPDGQYSLNLFFLCIDCCCFLKFDRTRGGDGTATVFHGGASIHSFSMSVNLSVIKANKIRFLY